MRLTDAPTVALLSAQLGYEATTAEITRRFAELNGDPDSGLVVAARGGAVVGWLHVYGVRLLETDGYAEVGGLVVAVAQRRRGVGRELVRRVKRWALLHGHRDLRLRSGVHRGEAHAFHESIGFERTKTSHLFRKVLT